MNEVKGVEVGGRWSEEPEVVRKEEKKLFEDIFVAIKDFSVRLGAVKFKSISLEDNLGLIFDFPRKKYGKRCGNVRAQRALAHMVIILTSLGHSKK